jgi:hypothetical protein
MTYEEMTHYIDTYSGAMWMTVKDDKITELIDFESYKGKLRAALIGMTVEQAQSFLKKTFKGSYMKIKQK